MIVLYVNPNPVNEKPGYKLSLLALSLSKGNPFPGEYVKSTSLKKPSV